MKYSKPEIELVEFDEVDVIRTSAEVDKDDVPSQGDNDTPIVPIFPK